MTEPDAAPDDRAAAVAARSPPWCSRRSSARILSGELAPGAKLIEAALAAAPGRLARAGARGLSHARGGRPGAHREEPRRVRARHPDRRGDRDLRPARGDGRSWSAAALAEHITPDAAEGRCARMVEAMEKAVKAERRRQLPPAQPASSTTAWSSSAATAS